MAPVSPKVPPCDLRAFVLKNPRVGSLVSGKLSAGTRAKGDYGSYNRRFCHEPGTMD